MKSGFRTKFELVKTKIAIDKIYHNFKYQDSIKSKIVRVYMHSFRWIIHIGSYSEVSEIIELSYMLSKTSIKILGRLNSIYFVIGIYLVIKYLFFLVLSISNVLYQGYIDEYQQFGTLDMQHSSSLGLNPAQKLLNTFCAPSFEPIEIEIEAFTMCTSTLVSLIVARRKIYKYFVRSSTLLFILNPRFEKEQIIKQIIELHRMSFKCPTKHTNSFGSIAKNLPSTKLDNICDYGNESVKSDKDIQDIIENFKQLLHTIECKYMWPFNRYENTRILLMCIHLLFFIVTLSFYLTIMAVLEYSFVDSGVIEEIYVQEYATNNTKRIPDSNQTITAYSSAQTSQLQVIERPRTLVETLFLAEFCITTCCIVFSCAFPVSLILIEYIDRFLYLVQLNKKISSTSLYLNSLNYEYHKSATDDNSLLTFSNASNKLLLCTFVHLKLFQDQLKHTFNATLQMVRFAAVLVISNTLLLTLGLSKSIAWKAMVAPGAISFILVNCTLPCLAIFSKQCEIAIVKPLLSLFAKISELDMVVNNDYENLKRGNKPSFIFKDPRTSTATTINPINLEIWRKISSNFDSFSKSFIVEMFGYELSQFALVLRVC